MAIVSKFVNRIKVDGKYIYQLRQFNDGVTNETLTKEVEKIDPKQDMQKRMQSFDDILFNLSVLLEQSEDINSFAEDCAPRFKEYKKNIQALENPVE